MVLARTEVGKTNLCLNLVHSACSPSPAAQTAPAVAVASLEMVTSEVVTRLLSINSGKDPQECLTAALSPNPNGVLSGTFPAYENVHVWDKPMPGWEDLGQWVDQVHTRTGAKVRMLVVDHLMLMGGYRGAGNPAYRVQQMADDAKVFAKEKGCALVVAHQASRGGGDGPKNHGDRPGTMEDAQYGGEQGVDVLLYVYRPDRNPNLTPASRHTLRGQHVLQTLKNRHGRSDVEGIKLQMRLPSLRLEEV